MTTDRLQVGLRAPAPEPCRAVSTRSCHRLTVGTADCVIDGVAIPGQRRPQRARLVEHASGAVGARGDDRLAVRAEMGVQHRIRLAEQDGEELTAAGVPYSSALIRARGEKTVAL